MQGTERLESPLMKLAVNRTGKPREDHASAVYCTEPSSGPTLLPGGDAALAARVHPLLATRRAR